MIKNNITKLSQITYLPTLKILHFPGFVYTFRLSEEGDKELNEIVI